ncbi:hypothetical protein ABW19_dt0203146 [Dactylella cylindrospora]|nr:hypothetical protein ABW19_dt0203146 [Dactylella cylindrospora]
MTSRPTAFSYPIPHSTFIPISHESVTASGQTRKRKRTKSLATNPSDDILEEDEGDIEIDAAFATDGHENVGLRTPWTPINPPQAEPSDSALKDEAAPYDDFRTKHKHLATNLEQRIRNAGYGEDITDALPPSQPNSLQAKHVDNVNTILHLCILKRDWARAKRAFALLLQSDREHNMKNLRLRKIWKLGVEILGWEGVDEAQAEDSTINAGDGGTVVKRDYSKVVEYMNRLIIMYPHYKHHVVGKGVNATTILPILMHFEILALEEQMTNATVEDVASVASQVISGIEGVTDRIKTLQETPPWVDMVELWKLRGQLYLWAAELSKRYLEDEKGYVKQRVLGHRLGQRMKGKGMTGWDEFVFEDGHDESENEGESSLDDVQVVI